MIFFTSDIHFGHSGVIRMCNRPFQSADEMDQTLIINWNSVVKETDEVYILGDICLGKSWKYAYKYLRELKGKISLVRGNHDKFLWDDKCDKEFFKLIAPYHELETNGRKLVLSHYPHVDWNGKYRESIHLFGHIHSPHWSTLQEFIGKAYDVGVDANYYFPVSIAQVIEGTKYAGLGSISQHIGQRKTKGENGE